MIDQFTLDGVENQQKDGNFPSGRFEPSVVQRMGQKCPDVESHSKERSNVHGKRNS